MKLNCKIGDLAVIVKCKIAPSLVGAICTVIANGDGVTRLPDGYATIPEHGHGLWVIEFAREVLAPTEYGTRFSIYAVCHDRNLRPIRDQPGADETLSWCDVPSEVTA